jgi:hypothetical protein
MHMTFAENVGFRPGTLSSFQSGSPALAHAAKVFLFLFAGMVLLQLADSRMINGVSVWVKPAKFFVSLGLQMATLAWGMSLVARPLRSRFRLDGAAWLFVALATFELSYMIYRASRGEASHFNHSSQIADILYAMMGLAAVTMMATTAWIGFAMMRSGSALSRVSGASFIMAALLTIAVGGYLSSQPSHWIGGDQTDATGLPLFGWSTTGGDLRPAHFVAMHVMQVAPIAALLAGPRAGWAAMLACVLGTVILFAQAVMGLPLITT